MSELDPHNEVKRLRDLLQRWGVEYYQNDAPTVSDSEFDRTLLALRELEEAHPQLVAVDSPTQRLGAARDDQSRVNPRH